MTLSEIIILGIFIFVIAATCRAAINAYKDLFKKED